MVSVPSTGDMCIGVFAAFVVAIGVYGIIIMFEFTDGASSIEVKSAKLAMVGDGQTSDIVHGNIVFVVDKYARLLLAGDVQEVELLMSDGNTSRIAVKDGSRIISYDGLLLLNEPASVGDEVHILIRHGGSQTEVVAVVERT